MHLWAWLVGAVVAWLALSAVVSPLAGRMLRESRERGEGE